MPKNFAQTEKAKTSLQHNKDLQSGKLKPGAQQQDEDEDDEDSSESDADAGEDTTVDDVSATTDVADKIQQMRLNGSRNKSGGPGRRPGPHRPKERTKSPTKKTPSQDSTYDGPLDMSEPVTSEQMRSSIQEKVVVVDGKELGEYGGGAPPASSGKKTGGLFSYFNSLTGTAEITEETLAPVLEKTRFHLAGKNVAAEIAEKICDAVGESLVGTSKGSFQSIATVVEQSIEASLTNILTPKRRIDILRDALACKNQKRPYTIVFCGGQRCWQINKPGQSLLLAASEWT